MPGTLEVPGMFDWQTDVIASPDLSGLAETYLEYESNEVINES